jgi:hypothetical protein
LIEKASSIGCRALLRYKSTHKEWSGYESDEQEFATIRHA